MTAGQDVLAVVSALGQTIHRRTAWITNAKHASHLIKALPRRIISACAHQSEVGIIPHVDDQRIAAGHTQRNKGRLQIRMGDVIGGDMTTV